jgi:hypothetical protein
VDRGTDEISRKGYPDASKNDKAVDLDIEWRSSTFVEGPIAD